MEGKEGAFHTQKTGGVNKMADKIECEIQLVKKQPREKLRKQKLLLISNWSLRECTGKDGQKEV